MRGLYTVQGLGLGRVAVALPALIPLLGAPVLAAEETGAEDAGAVVDAAVEAGAELAGTVWVDDTVVCASGEPVVVQAANVASATPRAATVRRVRRESRGENIR